MPHTLTLGLGGPSCSGKSTLCQRLRAALAPVAATALVCQDAFFVPDSLIPTHPVLGVANWDARSSTLACEFYAEIARQQEQAERRTSAFDAAVPPEDAPVAEELAAALRRSQITRVVLVDGFLAYDYTRNDDVYDARIFLYCPYDVLKQRRESRTIYVTKEDPPGYFANIVWPEFCANNAPIVPLAEDAAVSGARVSVDGRDYVVIRGTESKDSVFRTAVQAIIDCLDRKHAIN